MLSTGSSSASTSTSTSTSKPRTTESEHTPGPEKSSTRLYVGNLHPSVDEYTLIQVFSKYGKIAKLDFLFHKAGPMKGKPRGYAFVEYALKEEALQALIATNDKMLRGRKVSVTFANKSEYTEASLGGSGGLGPHRHRQSDNKPTTLSLLKNSQQPKSTNAKIAAMEAKLKMLKEQRSGTNDGGGPGSSSSGAEGRILPLPPPSAGLPSKPSATTTSRSELRK